MGTKSEPLFKKNWEIRAVICQNKCLFQDFLEKLPENEQNIIISFIERVAEKGPPKGKQRFRPLSKKIYELKHLALNIRLYTFFEGPQRLTIVFGEKKPKKKKLQNSIKKAERLRELVIGGGQNETQ